MWTWVPVLLLAAYAAVGWSVVAARVAGFAVVAVGAVGCVAAGAWADHLGRVRATTWSLAPGPVVGIAAMLRLRHDPAASGMADGRG